MLRASVQHSDHPGTTAAIVDDGVDPDMPGGRELLDFATTLVRSDTHRDPSLVHARTRLVDAVGPNAAARAASVTGNFEMMNRLLDAAGVPVPDAMLDVGRDHDVIA